MILNFIIILFSILGMYYGDKYNYSLNKIFYLFIFFFFGISPAIEFLLDVRYWHGSRLSDNLYIEMNILIILILIYYQGLYFIFQKFKLNKLEKCLIDFFDQKLKRKKKVEILLLGLSLLSLIIILYYNNFDIKGVLLRGGEDIKRIKVTKSISLIYNQFIKPLPVISLIIFKMKKIKDKKIEFLLLLIFIISNFPLSAARFYIAAVYIPILLLYVPFFKKKLIINQSLTLGMLFLFPFLDEMRRFQSFEKIKFGFNFKMFVSGHFDSYQNFARVIENNIVTNGKQLLTTVLFFVPRSMWAEKSVGSGVYLQNKLDLSFDNISMNYFGEGYINFGYFGILFFTILLAFINSRFDKIYWRKIDNKNILTAIYLLMLGMEFFILRGDLLSGFAYTVGFIFTSTFVYLIIKKY